MSETFEIVAREQVPCPRRVGRHRSALTKAVIDTATTGKVVRIELNGRLARNVCNGIRDTCRRCQPPLIARQHYVQSEGAIYMWAEAKS